MVSRSFIQRIYKKIKQFSILFFFLENKLWVTFTKNFVTCPKVRQIQDLGYLKQKTEISKFFSTWVPNPMNTTQQAWKAKNQKVPFLLMFIIVIGIGIPNSKTFLSFAASESSDVPHPTTELTIKTTITQILKRWLQQSPRTLREPQLKKSL